MDLCPFRPVATSAPARNMRRIRNMLSNSFAFQRIISLCSDLYNEMKANGKKNGNWHPKDPIELNWIEWKLPDKPWMSNKWSNLNARFSFSLTSIHHALRPARNSFIIHLEIGIQSSLFELFRQEASYDLVAREAAKVIQVCDTNFRSTSGENRKINTENKNLK